MLGQSFIFLLPLLLFFGITGVAEVVVKLVLRSEPLDVLTVGAKVL
jgi:ABC-type proline/glycine betaine transport system permease subunit